MGNFPDPYAGLSSMLKAMHGLPVQTQLVALVVICVLGLATIIATVWLFAQLLK